jgi:hypothetical protein
LLARQQLSSRANPAARARIDAKELRRGMESRQILRRDGWHVLCYWVIMHAARRQRWVRAIVALLSLFALSGAGQGYLYCHMAERPMQHCCCDRPGLTGGMGSAPVAERSCCEIRGETALPAIDPRHAPATVVLAPAVMASPAVEREAPRGWLLLEPPTSQPDAQARAGPPREGKRRARLGVMLC